uniref:Major facilitator superfamily associated domain-containing protein n=1 Tax=Timema bartmani TaxID=61472 RepID=A0A7R9I3N4_9NEOP|nr:unnamed protein product [Timema bartmani]
MDVGTVAGKKRTHLEDISTDVDQPWMKTLEGLVMGIRCFGGELPFFFLSGEEELILASQGIQPDPDHLTLQSGGLVLFRYQPRNCPGPRCPGVLNHPMRQADSVLARRILKMIGHIHAMSLVLAAFSIRFFLYAALTNPWWCLPIELLQGITYGIFYTTMASYANIAAPPGTEATVQGLVGAVFEGVGMSLGSLLGGVLYNMYGGGRAFLIYAITSLILFLAHVLVQYFLSKSPQHKILSNEGVERSFNLEKKSGIVPWLVTAKERSQSHLLVNTWCCSNPTLVTVSVAVMLAPLALLVLLLTTDSSQTFLPLFRCNGSYINLGWVVPGPQLVARRRPRLDPEDVDGNLYDAIEDEDMELLQFDSHDQLHNNDMLQLHK